jgi:hypothetical protein
MLATFLLAAIAAVAPPDAETGIVTFRPPSSSLAVAMVEVERGQELSVQLSNAAPANVEFVRYDSERSVLVCRNRTQVSMRTQLAEISPQRINAVRVVEHHKQPRDVLLGVFAGAISGATLGYLAGGSLHDEDGTLDNTAGAAAGMLLGSITGFVLGLALPDGKRTERVVWVRERK